MTTPFQFRRDSAANWDDLDPILAEGEIGIELDTSRIKIGNGVDPWTVLPFYGGGNNGGSAATFNTVYPLAYDNFTQTLELNYGTGLTVAQNHLNVEFGTTSTTVTKGDDSRLSDARTPTAHKTSHATGGTDALSPSDIGAASSSHDHSGVYDPAGTAASQVTTHSTATTSIHGITNTANLLYNTALGSANGIATLDANSKVTSTQLTSASTSTAGIVQLTDSTASTSITTAATPNSVKSAYDLANGKAAAVHTHTESDVTNLTTDLASKVSTSRTISTTLPLTGGGDLSANRTLAVNTASTTAVGVVQFATAVALALAGTAAAGSTGTVADAGHVHPTTVNGEFSVQSLKVDVATTTTALDFATQGYKTITLTGATTFTASNYATGRTITVRITNNASANNLTFPSTWVFVGTKPTSIAASKVGILTVTSFGTTEADCVAAWAVQA